MQEERCSIMRHTVDVGSKHELISFIISQRYFNTFQITLTLDSNR